MPSFKNLRRKPENSQETFFLFPKSGHLATQRAIFFKSYFTKKYAPPNPVGFQQQKCLRPSTGQEWFPCGRSLSGHCIPVQYIFRYTKDHLIGDLLLNTVESVLT